MSGPAYCLRCGHSWDRDPVLEVACPVCKQGAGSPCVSRAPSGHVKSRAFGGLKPWGHDERDLLAAEQGHYDHKCITSEGRETVVEKPARQQELGL